MDTSKNQVKITKHELLKNGYVVKFETSLESCFFIEKVQAYYNVHVFPAMYGAVLIFNEVCTEQECLAFFRADKSLYFEGELPEFLIDLKETKSPLLFNFTSW